MTKTFVMPERRENDFYPTPLTLARAMVGLCKRRVYDLIFDPGIGTGVFGKALQETVFYKQLYGIEIDSTRIEQALNTGAYTHIQQGSFLEVKVDYGGTPDLFIGNPPFSKVELWVDAMLDQFNDNGSGEMVLLLPLNFLASQRRYRKYWSSEGKRPEAVYILPQRPSFYGKGTAIAKEFAVFHWSLNWGEWATSTTIKHLIWDKIL